MEIRIFGSGHNRHAHLKIVKSYVTILLNQTHILE
jgi:hypothetical protein